MRPINNQDIGDFDSEGEGKSTSACRIVDIGVGPEYGCAWVWVGFWSFGSDPSRFGFGSDPNTSLNIDRNIDPALDPSQNPSANSTIQISTYPSYPSRTQSFTS
jgi:hypothetical protein